MSKGDRNLNIPRIEPLKRPTRKEEEKERSDEKMKAPEDNVTPGASEALQSTVDVPETTELAGTPESGEKRERPGQRLTERLRSGDSTPVSYRLLGDEYLANEKAKEKDRLERRKKKERGRMTASALADSLRLIGHGAAINKGAYETPWERNEGVETGMRNLDRYQGEYLDTIRRLEELELRDKERAQQLQMEDEAAQDEMEQRERMAEGEAAQDQREFAYEAAQDEADRKLEQERLDLERQREERLWAKMQQDAEEKGNEPAEEDFYKIDQGGSMYGINPKDKDHISAVSEMISKKINDLDERRSEYDEDAWEETEFYEQYQALKKLNSQNWPNEFGSVLSRMPYVWDSEVAEKYGIPVLREEEEDAPREGPLDTIERINKGFMAERERKQKNQGQSTQPEDGNTRQETEQRPQEYGEDAAPAQAGSEEESGQVDAGSQTQEAPEEQEQIDISQLPADSITKLKQTSWDELGSEEQMAQKKEVLKQDYLKSDFPDDSDEAQKALNDAAEGIFQYMNVNDPDLVERQVNRFGGEDRLIEALKEELRKRKSQ